MDITAAITTGIVDTEAMVDTEDLVDTGDMGDTADIRIMTIMMSSPPTEDTVELDMADMAGTNEI